MLGIEIAVIGAYICAIYKINKKDTKSNQEKYKFYTYL